MDQIAPQALRLPPGERALLADCHSIIYLSPCDWRDEHQALAGVQRAQDVGVDFPDGERGGSRHAVGTHARAVRA